MRTLSQQLPGKGDSEVAVVQRHRVLRMAKGKGGRCHRLLAARADRVVADAERRRHPGLDVKAKGGEHGVQRQPGLRRGHLVLPPTRRWLITPTL
jgi:hypothetical protein